jgi:hypothetical protein
MKTKFAAKVASILGMTIYYFNFFYGDKNNHIGRVKVCEVFFCQYKMCQKE